MRCLSAAIVCAVVIPGSAREDVQPVENTVVYKEKGRFAGWPANNGIWSWGDEVVVGFTLGYYKMNPLGGHAIDRDKPSVVRQARSLDGGATWTVEVPSFLDENDRERKSTDPPGGIDFTHPALAVRFRQGDYCYSLDRCKTWHGPYRMPTFGRKGLLARTDYLVEGKHRLTAFLAATKDDGKEGQPLCARTLDGGKTWNLVGWIGEQPPEGYGYAIMPSTVRLTNGAYLSMIRRGGVLNGKRTWWLEAYQSPDEGRSWHLLDEPRIDNGGNPASMIRLRDGRIALTYGWRHPPYGIRARLSEDEGRTWGRERILRRDGASWDLGYPRTVQRSDGKCLTVYYYHHADQPERYIACTIWDPGRRSDAASSQPRKTTQPVNREDMRRFRKEAAHRRRRIIYNNDGDEPFIPPKAVTPEAFLELRTTAVAGTHVDAVFYCTAMCFGYAKNHSRVWQLFTCREDFFARNAIPDFHAKGLDPLVIISQFCRTNGIEVFASMRMNDVHDSYDGRAAELEFPPFKKAHPEYLMGTADRRPKNGGWTAVDYGQPEIREMAFRYLQDICDRYDIDGLELDFFRHPTYFRRHANGEEIGQEELHMMTGLLQRIRQAADEAACKRGRPILVAVRVPDSVDFCKAIGLDIERWMREDLIDILVVSCYFRLNPWDVSVKLGHRYGVPVYPCLSETRIKDEEAAKVRRSLECYRGRAMNVWASGADGVYLFNHFDPHSALWRQLGDPKALRGLDRVYVTTARGSSNLEFYFKGGSRFQKCSFITPTNPRRLKPGTPEVISLCVGEKLDDPPAPNKVTLQLRFQGVAGPKGISVKLNGQSLEGGTRSGAYWDYVVSPGMVKCGDNTIEITLPSDAGPAVSLQDLLLWVRPGGG